MEKELLSYDYSFILKELGFNQPCCSFFIERTFGGGVQISRKWVSTQNDYSNQLCSRPTFSQAFDWFMTEHKLEGQVKSWTENDKLVYYVSTEPLGKPSRFKCYEIKTDNPLQARIECLKILISKVKENLVK